MPTESFFSDASLAFFASTESAKEGTAYSMKPTDGSGDFTFTRGSNLSATYVGKDGYIKKGYENTIIGSNDFALDNSSYTITNGEAGYDGTNDAWFVNKLLADNSYFRKDGLVYTGVMTISIYAKAGTLDRLGFITAGDYVVFDLENVNAYKLGGTPIAQTIELVSGTTDWYRCSMTINKSTTTNLLMKPVDNSNQNASGTIYVQDIQLNEGLVAYPYLETTTAKAINALTDNEPRYDWLSGSAALLLEPSRTNIIQSSEYFDYLLNGDALSLDYNNLLSPEGYVNAVKCTPRAVSALNRLEYQATLSIPKTYTFSMFAKANGYDYFLLRFVGTSAGSVNASFNLTTGEKDYTSSGIQSTIEPYANGWYRLSVTISVTSSLLRTFFRPQPSAQLDDSIGTYTGNGTSGCYIYGLQLEQDATYPTSYIPTYGTTKERLADSAIASVTNTTSRTYYIEGSRLSDENYASSNGFYDPDDNLAITFWSSNRLRFRFGGAINDYYTLVGNDFKIAISYDGTDCIIYINGQEWKTRTFTLGNVSSIRLQSSSGAVSFNKTLYFPTALSYDDCITLTTP